jgi:hypothetical protein
MPTPLDQYASLTMAVLVPTGTITDGDVAPEMSTTELVLTAWVRVGGGSERSEGSNVLTQVPLAGYFLQPQRPPAVIRPGVAMPAILWRLSANFNLTNEGRLRTWRDHTAYYQWIDANRQHVDHDGTFTLSPTLASQYVLPDNLLGKRLSGVFAYRTAWGDAV